MKNGTEQAYENVIRIDMEKDKIYFIGDNGLISIVSKENLSELHTIDA